ncbi:ATP-dependent DNA helicase PIF1 [Exaiptasia diaphana]|nr:ATP-dependent DNA helicase PIF1 [Exaiptasia diaphana]
MPYAQGTCVLLEIEGISNLKDYFDSVANQNSVFELNKMSLMIDSNCEELAFPVLFPKGRKIPGTPPYWQKIMYEVIAMVKQLGIPTWFMTLSCEDLRWNDLFQIIAKIKGMNYSDDDIARLSYNERCSLLNPVIVAKHFQYRVETFFTEVLLSNSNPIGKIVYYALRIEFQMRGSPHLHALIWNSDCPRLTNETKAEYIEFIDHHVQAYLPDEEVDSQLHNLVKTYQKHSHSRTCRKYKNLACRFSFGQFFANRTIISEPLPNDLDEFSKMSILNKRKEILSLVKEKIDEHLNPSVQDYNPTLTEKDILSSLGISETEYYSALSVSSDDDFGLHLKRPVNSCFINNYFPAGLKGFQANVDLQPVFNHYKCITYVCSYFTKDETECSQAIMNAAKEAKKSNLNTKDTLRKIGAAFLSTREVSSQECAYRCMPELWLRKTFPASLFIATDFPENRIRIAKSQNEIKDLPDDSTDIFKSNIIQRYSLRPTTNSVIANLCLAQFASYYYKDYNDNYETADAQPEVLKDDVMQSQSTTNICLPKQVKLMNNEIMKCRKVKAVIRNHTPNKTKEPEKYYHHLLFLYFPWVEESSLLGQQQTYESKFAESNVQNIVEQNRLLFEPDGNAVNEALQSVGSSPTELFTLDSMNDQENANLCQDIQNNSVEPDESFNQLHPSHLNSSHCHSVISTYPQPHEITDDNLRQSVRGLNKKQRNVFDKVLSWCRSTIKNVNTMSPQEIKPLYLFISGGGGAGKSHLIRTLYHSIHKAFKYSNKNPDLPTVILMAPTGVAAVNIGATTINTALAIPKNVGDTVPSMNDHTKTQMRLSLRELKLIIIDEVSMVSNSMLLYIHQRLKEIFGTPNSLLFAGISVIAFGDLYQLPPIGRKPVFEQFKNDLYNLSHPWMQFLFVELTEIMRQKNDNSFIELLNRIRTCSQTEEDIQTVNTRLISPSDQDYPSDALHIWAENNPVTAHNNKKLDEIDAPLYVLTAIDHYPQNVSEKDIESVLSKGRSETGGLDFKIHIKKGARVMLTSNIDINDRLINGQMGTVHSIVSSDDDFGLHLKRPVNSCFINNYFPAGLKGFQANVDLQPVFNHYKCITYVCSYFTKDETECSQAIMNAAKEAKKSNLNTKDTLRKIGAAFLSTREVSSQECAYRCMPELWLRKTFPASLFIATDFPENRIRIAKSQNEIKDLPDDSTDIFKSNIIQRYSLRLWCM